MPTNTPRSNENSRQSSKRLFAKIAAVVAAVALFVGNVDKIWTTVSGRVTDEKSAPPPTIVIQISADTLAKAAAQATAVANAASGAARAEASQEASNLKVASENLKIPITLGSATESIPSWLAIALKEVGQKEISGAEHNPRIIEYIASVNPNLVSEGDELPWSTFFINWVMFKAGIQGTRSGAGHSWLQWGTELKTPKPGAVAVFQRPNQPQAAHACLYVGDAGDQIICLSGNVSNSVQVSAMSKSNLIGYRWPKDV